MASPYDTPRIPDFDHNSFNLQVRSWIEYWLLRWDSRLSPTEAKVLSEKFEGDGDVAFKFERAQWVALYGPVKGNLIDSKIRELQSPYVDVRYFTSSIQALLIVKERFNRAIRPHPQRVGLRGLSSKAFLRTQKIRAH